MNNSTYRWVIVAAGGLLGCVARRHVLPARVSLADLEEHGLVRDERLERHDPTR